MSAPRFLMIPGAPTPVAPFSHAVEVDGWLFLTGQMPTDPNAMQPVRVYVASELAPDTCRHDVTLSHEMKHVEVLREALGLAARLVTRSREGGPYPTTGSARGLARSRANAKRSPALRRPANRLGCACGN